MTRRSAPGLLAAALFAVLAVLVGVHWGPLLRFDERAARELVVGSGSSRPWRVATDVLQPTVWRALALVVAVTLYRRYRRTADALRLAVATVGAIVLGLVLKQIVGRHRPAVAVEQVGGLSFPSSHALTAAVVATAFVLLAPSRLRVVSALVAVALVALTAASRVALGVHYVSDVVGGVLLGAAIAGLAMTTGRSVDRPAGVRRRSRR